MPGWTTAVGWISALTPAPPLRSEVGQPVERPHDREPVVRLAMVAGAVLDEAQEVLELEA